MNYNKPIFKQIMDIIEGDILRGVYKKDDIIISTTQIAKVYSVNPATAIKAISTLTNNGILYKKRGIGMAVTEDAKEIILNEHKNIFFNSSLQEFISEAEKLGITKKELAKIILDFK